MEIYEVVKKLVGPINPVGESHVDDIRLENLKVMTKLIDDLIDDVYLITINNRNKHEHSIKQSYDMAKKFCDSLKDWNL